MRQLIHILTVFLLTTQCFFGQHTDNKKLYERLRKSIDNEWIKENPVFKTVKSSFFNKDNEDKYYVGLSQFSGLSIPFGWDNNLSFLYYLMTNYPNFSILTGQNADENFKGTKIYWETSINGLIWFNDRSYKATVDNWYLSTQTECPGTIIFPTLSFKKIIDIPNALTNNIQGLMVMPYTDKLSISASETSMFLDDGTEINGISFDIDNDEVFDIFTYQENIDETTFYIRLYINVNGEWKCKWISLDETCL